MKTVATLGATLALLAAGCGGGQSAYETPTTTGTPTVPATTTTAPAETTSFRVYVVRGERLGVARRTVPKTQAVATAALGALLDGPTSAERSDAGLGTEIPPGTRLLGVSIADGTATVDLSRAFESGGGSASMLMRVAQVVFTLTQFPTVQRVAFELDGAPVSAIGGEGVVVDPTPGRRDFESQAPAILVESPAPFDTVSSPLRVSGSANTFEATLNVELTGADGTTLAEQVVTATSGTGERGTFAAELPFAAAAPGRLTLTAFTYSAKDGSKQDVVAIPLEPAR